MSADGDWQSPWRGRWIWDRAPEESYWWRSADLESRFVLLRRIFEVAHVPATLPIRVTCDSRYELSLNGAFVGRGPVRGEPEHLGWDTYELGPLLRVGANVIVALCRYYGRPGPWWLPASPLGTLGRGSFCLESSPDAEIEILTDARWQTAEAGRGTAGAGNMHAFPPELVDGRRRSDAVHDPAVDDQAWPNAVVVSGRGHGTVLDRPPAAPYMTPLRRPIPALTRLFLEPQLLTAGAPVDVEPTDDPLTTWASAGPGAGPQVVTVWDLGRISVGHPHLRVEAGPDQRDAVVDIVGGEDLRADGFPEIAPRDWAGRYIAAGRGVETVSFFDPVGLRYLAALHPPDVKVGIGFEEARYPREEGASFESDDARYDERWRVGLRTVDVCSTDAFLDCPGREQRAWVSDAYPQVLVSLVTNPDRRLVRHHLELTSRSRLPSGLLAAAAACDFARVGFTNPEYSLHWIRSLAAYWIYSGDEPFVRRLLPIANAIIERYELQRGSSGFLEEFPGWVFLDWAQVDRDVVTGTHDALYAAALGDYATLPGAADVGQLIDRTAAAFEALWDADRGVYVDAIGRRGPSRRISQHTNGAALLAGIVPRERVSGVIERIVDPRSFGGRLVVTQTAADARAAGRIPTFQYEPPVDFDEERDVVAAQPWFCRYLHEALFRHDRRDLILASLLRWQVIPGNGTFQEFWSAEAGRSSRCQGWSASPTFDLTTYILGVRPTAPGFEKMIIDPYLGTLGRAAGRVPTPHGWLTVRVDGATVGVDIPAGIKATVGATAVEAGQTTVSLESSGEDRS
ncbi:MAG: alpha-L-rhamnosidase C-terminal domain-containing protein [Candidatus Limnocylindrales bacterium]